MRTSFAIAVLVASACADPNFDKVRSNLIKITNLAGTQTNWGLDLSVAGKDALAVPLSFTSAITKIKGTADTQTAIDAAKATTPTTTYF